KKNTHRSKSKQLARYTKIYIEKHYRNILKKLYTPELKFCRLKERGAGNSNQQRKCVCAL
ncbi:TPA: hypothetical protein ACXGMM_004420, partial [Escherichia coli]